MTPDRQQYRSLALAAMVREWVKPVPMRGHREWLNVSTPRDAGQPNKRPAVIR